MDAKPVASYVLLVLAWACRALAIVFAVFTVVLCFGSLIELTVVADGLFWLQSIVPDPLAGLFVYSTPLGGAFRGDFAIASLALFIADWAFMRIAAALR